MKPRKLCHRSNFWNSRDFLHRADDSQQEFVCYGSHVLDGGVQPCLHFFVGQCLLRRHVIWQFTVKKGERAIGQHIWKAGPALPCLQKWRRVAELGVQPVLCNPPPPPTPVSAAQAMLRLLLDFRQRSTSDVSEFIDFRNFFKEKLGVSKCIPRKSSFVHADCNKHFLFYGKMVNSVVGAPVDL